MSNTETSTDQLWECANEAILSASYAKSKEAEQGLLEFAHLPHSADSPQVIIVDRQIVDGRIVDDQIVDGQEHRTVESCERELIRRRRTEIQLRDALAREEALLHQKDELIRQMVVLHQESDHRLLNGAQMIVSLLTLQGRASKNAEVASQLAAAADRVATICRIHRHLHSFDGVRTIAIKEYLEELCRDFSKMLSLGSPDRVIAMEGIEINLSADTAIPLGFIANELLTNAAKYGTGRITLSLESDPQKGYLLSVSNEGPSLPEGFDPDRCKGLGMRIIRSFVEQIGGEFRIDRGDSNQGTKFTVLFF
jgi:two-component system, sensor histidine kinase PdtaS